MYNEFIKIKTNYISHANIYSTRNFGSIFFALFSGCCEVPACHSERRRRVFEGAGFLFEGAVCCISALPQRQTVCRMTIFENVILSVSEISRCVRICFVHFFLFAATKKKETQPKKEKTLPKRNLEFFF